jgi:hypothetical protein
MSHSLHSRHKKVLSLIFETPTRADLRWDRVVNLFTALGATVTQRKGSRVGVALHRHTAIFHAPHPRPVMIKGSVEAVREFLINAGITPD